MNETIIEISICVIASIVLGYIFGWLITKTRYRDKYEKKIKEFNKKNQIELENINKKEAELNHFRLLYKELVTNNNNLHLRYDELEKKLEFSDITRKELAQFVESKDDMIAKLTHQLTLEEDKLLTLQNEQEKEIDAFLYERTDITQKYKALLSHLKEIKEHQGDFNHDDDSWFGKLFKVS